MRSRAKFSAECKRCGYFHKCYRFMTQSTMRHGKGQLSPCFVLQSSAQKHRHGMVFWRHFLKNIHLYVCVCACICVHECPQHTCGHQEMTDLRSGSELVCSDFLYLHVPAYLQRLANKNSICHALTITNHSVFRTDLSSSGRLLVGEIRHLSRNRSPQTLQTISLQQILI